MDISVAHFPTLLLTLAFLSVTHGQYYDIFQGLQQFLQPYQPQNDFFSQYNNFNNYQEPVRQPSRPEQHKKKTEDQRNVIKYPAVFQYDYVFTTTPKPSRKSTKPNSSHTSKQTNRHHNTDIVNNYSSFEVTTKRNRVTTNNKKTTTVRPNNRVTTENIFGFSNNRGSNNYNRPVTENVFENNRRKEVYAVNNYETQTSRRPDNTASNVDYTSNPNRATNNRNPNVQNINLNSQKNRVTNNGLNTRPTNTRNPDVSGINIQKQVISNNRHPSSGPTTAALISDHNNRNNNYNRGNNVTPNNDRVVFNTDYDANNGNFYPNNPLINRPGVRPASIDPNQPPITNKPITDRNNFVTARPSDDFGSYGRPDETPEILIGPDEDDMTEEQKRRYIEVAEKMCVRYKSLNVKEVVALPLLPSPDPVELNVSSCEPITIPLVIGGKVVSIKEFPHMALVGWRNSRANGYSWKCGGSLISDQYVLTAGHCTYEDRDSNIDSGPPQAVQLGSSYMNGPGALIVKISSVIRHPKYKMIRRYYDIALIKLARTVTFSEVIRPACLGVPPPVGDSVIATGWGRTEFGGDNSVELRSVSLPVWDITECREIWGTSRKLPNGPTAENHMCAGERAGGKDTCQGDSGGPAQVQDGCVWRVVAVTSFGRSCGAPNTPALYVKTRRAFIAAQVFGSQIEQIGSQGQRYDDRRPTYRPQSFENRPQSFENRPQSFENRPQSFENRPQSFENRPQSFENRPQSFENRPQSFENRQSFAVNTFRRQ